MLAFPGVFKGLLAVRASKVTDSMKEAAARALAGIITDAELKDDYVLPDPFDPRAADAIADAVAAEAVKLGLNRI